MKTAELNGIALDYAVTLIENPDALKYGVDDWRQRRKYETKNGEFLFRWASSWAQAGSIIEREGIGIAPKEFVYSGEIWLAMLFNGSNESQGPTPLIAAMRAYVTECIGDEIDIPTELMEGK